METRKLSDSLRPPQFNLQRSHFLCKSPWTSAFAISLAGISGMTTHAEGFRNPPEGTFGLGRSGGRIAQVDDASAVVNNPANLIDLKETTFSFDPEAIFISTKFQSANGDIGRTRDLWKVLPNFFASYPLFADKAALGLAVTVPYGLSNKWEQTGAFADPAGLRYQAPYFSELKTINFDPTVSLRLCSHVTLGVGLDVMWSQLKFHQFYPWFLAVPGSPDGVANAKGDGVGLGGNLGLTWQVTEADRLSVTYRSPISVNYGGKFEVNNVPAAFGGGSINSTFGSRIIFPTIVAVGYGNQLSDTVRMEFDAEWLEFSNFQTLPLNIPTGPPGLPAGVREAWKNTFTLGVSADWKFAPDWSLAASYQYYESPVPDQTFSTTIPDANQNAITFGLKYRHQRHSLGVAYGEVLYDPRNIKNDQNPVFNGRYETSVHIFAVTYAYSF